MSSYGFVGTRDASRPVLAGLRRVRSSDVNPEFAKSLKERRPGWGGSELSRNLMTAFHCKPPFGASEEREEVLLSSMLSMKVPEENDPGGSGSL